MTTLVIGSGLIGSQVARILVERGEKPVLMDHAAQPHAIGQIVDLGKVTLIAGDVLRPLSVVDAILTNSITKIVHTAANPLLTLGAQKEPYAAINLNIMGTTNVLEAARDWSEAHSGVVIERAQPLPGGRIGSRRLRTRRGVSTSPRKLLRSMCARTRTGGRQS